MADTKRIKQSIYFWIFRAMSMMVVFILVAILYFIVSRGIGVINWDFLTKSPEEGMVKGGILPAIVGTLVLIAGSLIFAFPVGVFSAIYLNEYMKKGRVKSFLQLMTNNLAGVPSVVFGLFGMALFVNKLKFGDSILAGSLTLGLLVLPVIIRTTEEALKAVDDNYRLASYAMGASKLYTIKKVILPIALPDIITGLILSIGRVSGETAPILFTVAAYFLPKLPHSIFDQVMALPYHLYVLATSGTNIEKARPVAFGTALVLVMIVLFTNIIANVVRAYYNKKYKK